MIAAPEMHIPPSVIIADDDPAVVKLLADRCGKMGFRVATAGNGMQLLIKARQNLPDVLIVDVNMPGLDGMSASSHFLEPSKKPVDVIVMTGSSNQEIVERCESLGMFYCRKGPDFWPCIEAALTEIFPSMDQRIKQIAALSADGTDVPQRPRVLIVDDDPAVGALFATRLAKLGVEMLYASNATQAYRAACKQHPSVVITDYNMPDGDAQHLISRLRNTPATEKIPVFILSGHTIDKATEDRLRRELFGRSGAEKIFKKSYDLSKLFGALEEFCAFEKEHERA